MIARKLAYRILADALASRAGHLRGLTPESADERRGFGAGMAAAPKQVGRSNLADVQARQGERLWHLGSQDAVSRRAVIDPSHLGLLIAWTYGDPLAYRDLVALRPDLASVDKRDIPKMAEGL